VITLKRQSVVSHARIGETSLGFAGLLHWLWAARLGYMMH